MTSEKAYNKLFNMVKEYSLYQEEGLVTIDKETIEAVKYALALMENKKKIRLIQNKL